MWQGTSHRAVLQGVDHNGMEYPGIDWYQASGQRACLDRVAAYLSEWWGEPEEGPGRYCYTNRWRWINGAELWFNEREEGQNWEWCTVSLPGGALAELTAEQRLLVTRELFKRGMNRVKRVDLPLDFKGRGLTLIQQVEAACLRGELCGLRTHSPIPTHRGRRLIGYTLYLGKRGNGFVNVCIYDKGLELSGGKSEAGSYIRWETRFEGEAAAIAIGHLWAAWDWEQTHKPQQMTMVLGDGPDENSTGEVACSVQAQYIKLVFSGFDFREASTKGDRHRTRRRRAGWYVLLLGEVKPQILRRGRRRYHTLDGHTKWLRATVFPSLRLLEELTGRSPIGVLRAMGYDWTRTKERIGQVEREFLQRLWAVG